MPLEDAAAVQEEPATEKKTVGAKTGNAKRKADEAGFAARLAKKLRALSKDGKETQSEKVSNAGTPAATIHVKDADKPEQPEVEEGPRCSQESKVRAELEELLDLPPGDGSMDAVMPPPPVAAH